MARTHRCMHGTSLCTSRAGHWLAAAAAPSDPAARLLSREQEEEEEEWGGACWRSHRSKRSSLRLCEKVSAWKMVLGHRKLVFFLPVFYFLLLLTVSQGEREVAAHAREMQMGGGGWEEQRLLGRMGSTPPCCVCARRCGGCSPCAAVQVRAGAGAVSPQCAGYEPVRWKCKCGDALFDP